MSKEFLRFVSLEHISLGIRFKVREAVESYEDQAFLEYKIVTAAPKLGFDKHGNYTEADRFQLLDDNQNPVDDFEDAVVLAAGNIFEPQTIVFSEDPTFTITIFETVMFKPEFKALSEFINSGYLEKVYKETIV